MFKYLSVLLLASSCIRPVSIDEMLQVKKLVTQAKEKINSRELDQAEALINLAAEISANEPIVIDALGCLAWHRKNIDLAESYFRQAILINPKFENSYLNLAIVMEQKGDISQAKSLLEKTLKINPLNHRARNNYAGIIFDYAISTNEKDLARKELNKALNSAPALDRVLKYNIDKFNRSRARLN